MELGSVEQPLAHLTRRSLVALVRCFPVYPRLDTDELASLLVRAGWDVLTRMHNGQALRTSEPRKWRRRKVEPFHIRDDQYACPELYVEMLKREGMFDKAIDEFLTTGPQPDMSQPRLVHQSLLCHVEFDSGALAAIATYSLANSLIRNDAINRLISVGAYRVLAPRDKIWFQYYDENTKKWCHLPRVAA